MCRSLAPIPHKHSRNSRSTCPKVTTLMDRATESDFVARTDTDSSQPDIGVPKEAPLVGNSCGTNRANMAG